MSRSGLFARQPAADRRRQLSKTQRYPRPESLRQGRTQTSIAFSPPVNLYVTSEPAKLNSNRICAVRSCAVRWLNSYFGSCLKAILCRITDDRFPTRAKLNSYREGVRASGGIGERGRGIRHADETVLRAI